MNSHPGAAVVGGITRRLASRRWQVAHWLGKALVPRRPFVGRFLGGRLEVHPGETASGASFFLGFYEREVTIWCRELIRRDPPTLLVDVGANFGYYPLLFGLLTGGATRSIAFEPEPSNLAWLRRNIALNPGLDIVPVGAAVGGRDGESIPFEVAKEGHNLWARGLDRAAQVEPPHFEVAKEGHNLWARVAGDGAADAGHSAGTIDVPVVRLDDELDRRGVGEVPLVLIDVEGFEGEVLDGMAAGLAAHRYKRVLVEFHPWAFEPGGMERIARGVVDRGYRMSRFVHWTSPYEDKDRDFYRLDFDDAILGPPAFDRPTSWEHYLFESESAAARP